MTDMVNFNLRYDSREQEFPCQICPTDQGLGYVSLSQTHDVQYTLYYKNNSAIGVFGNCCITSGVFGYHEHDIERITVLRDGRVHLSAHGHTQGTWTHLRDLEVDCYDRYILYVARGSHAFYPKPGKVWRIFGFANDECDGKGKRIDICSYDTCIGYDHHIAPGFDITSTIIYPDYACITPLKRFLIPFTI
jgi:hypothetical protein